MLQNFILLLPLSVCLLWALTLLYNKKANIYSYKVWITFALLAITNFFIAEIGERFIFSCNPIIISLILIIWTGILYYMGYRIYQKRYVVKSLNNGQTSCQIIDRTDDHPEETETSNKAHYKLLPDLNRIIDEEKIFLQNNLNIEKVARMLNTNRTYISRLINQEYQCSFSDFINQKRIVYAQELAHSYPELTQEQIAEKAGFTLASSFSRTFKQQVGQTFREWSRNDLKNLPLSD